jgi:hypothetical protein
LLHHRGLTAAITLKVHEAGFIEVSRRFHSPAALRVARNPGRDGIQMTSGQGSGDELASAKLRRIETD